MPPRILGIDFGTTYSSMAMLDAESGRAVVLRNQEGEEKTPSIVCFGEDGTVAVGAPAWDLLDDDEAAWGWAFLTPKRHLGDVDFVRGLPDGRVVTAVDATAAILRKLREDAEAGDLGGPADTVVLTCPASFGPTARDGLREAAALAGLGDVRLLEEPVAAGLAGLRDQGGRLGETILVYDLGGGTFDVAVLRRDGSGYRLGGEPRGMERCGGEDFDQAIYDWFDGLAQAERGQSFDGEDGLNPTMLKACRRAKEMLSTKTDVPLRGFLDGKRFEKPLSRCQLEELIGEQIAATVRLSQDVAEAAERRGHAVDSVLLIGGSSRIPLVQQQLRDALTQPKGLAEPVRLGATDFAVVMGAVYFVGESAPRELVVGSGPGQYRRIQQALDVAPAGATIRITAGRYQEVLTITVPVHLLGDGDRDSIILEAEDADVIDWTAPTGSIRNLTLRQLGGDGFSCVDIGSGSPVLENLDISAQNTGDTGAGILIHKLADPVIRNNRIHDGKDIGIAVIGPGKGTIEGNDIYANAGSGVFITAGGDPIIRKNCIHDGGYVGIAVHGHSKGTIEGNDIYNNTHIGVNVVEYSSPIIRNNRIHDGKNVGISVMAQCKGMIEGNDIYNNIFTGILIATGCDPLIRNNRIYGGGHVGIAFHDHSKGTIEGNEIFNNTLAGISIKTGCDPVIRNNRIYDGKDAGIGVSDQGKGTIEGNDIHSNTFAGISIMTGGDPIVRNNCIHDGKHVGIAIHNQGKGTIEGNDIYANTKDGIFIATGGDPIIRNNRIHDGKDAGIFVLEQGKGMIEGNDIHANTNAGICVMTGGDPVIRNNRIHDGKDVGILVREQGQGTIEGNDIYSSHTFGIVILDRGDPIVRRNRIDTPASNGIRIVGNGCGTIENNKITRCNGLGIAWDKSSPAKIGQNDTP
ncbi:MULTISPECIES: right-handed parallel beta-helix repeat-containing protein [unclassified Azospirillum]|uniref:right-handed parallel beta-helix repeat-containing protein n=1 Tax=unclassified Azospirillum TaxID=2630922 RepID=UPI000B62F641|nr:MULTISPECIES: right-handed parallel beta-helix repeat-containing protein [unclassified Azospirillum]SNT09228.1 parallel beta-helix repeat (two copies) [Azospirillum sp. RU38E]SNT24855.1 parallel beta-helix repeat (two copies) [Azospirillum sp. RU37A]